MNTKIITVLLFLFSFIIKGNASNEPMTRDSLRQLFISFGQKKIQSQMDKNQNFIKQGIFDSLNYIITIDSRDMIFNSGLSAEFIREYIPDGLVDGGNVQSIITKESLTSYNKKIADINEKRTIKTYMLFINYLELNVSDVFDDTKLTDAFYNQSFKDLVDSKPMELVAVQNAEKEAQSLITKLSS